MTSTSLSSQLFIITILLSFLSISKAQDRAPHGLAKESPMAFSPSAYDFFHPTKQNPNIKDPCSEANCSPLPIAAQVHSSEGHESRYFKTKKEIGASGVLGIVFGVGFVVVSAMGVYYAFVTRKANMSRASAVKPDV